MMFPLWGGDARNYSFKMGGIESDAENGLTLSATGKINPKDLSYSFEKVTKVYDGTKNVPAGAIKFIEGVNGVLKGDTVVPHYTNAEFQSPDVEGDSTHPWIPEKGPEQGRPHNNYVNYTGLSLVGTDAGNYFISPTARGLGEILPLPPEAYVPDAEYYKALTQLSKMLPDEYAYENASLDRRSHFGRKAEVEVSYEPPSINMVRNGIDLGMSNILVTDHAVFEIVNEVFG